MRKAFINGLAGEQFALRDSESELRQKGAGDDGCEYMTEEYSHLRSDGNFTVGLWLQ